MDIKIYDYFYNGRIITFILLITLKKIYNKSDYFLVFKNPYHNGNKT